MTSSITDLYSSPSDLELSTAEQDKSFLYSVKQFLAFRVVETVSLSLAMSLLFFGGAGWSTWTTYQGFRETVSKQFRLQKLNKDTTYYDEALTMSAYMAASTGDLQWAKRYDSFVPKLDTTLAEIIRDFPSAKADFDQTKDAADKLYALEDKAFQVLRQGRKQEAARILFGREYAQQKQIYAKGVQVTLEHLDQMVTTELGLYSQRLFQSVVFVGVSLPLLILTWAVIFSAVRTYVKERNQAQKHLLASQESLLQLNQELAQRTHEIELQEQSTRENSILLEKDISVLLDVVSAVEDGNLTVQAPVSDRVTGLVSDTLNRLIEELARIITAVLATVDQVAQGVENLDTLAMVTAQQAQQQTQAVDRVQGLMETVSTLSQDNAQRAMSTNSAVQEAQTAVAKGQHTLTTLTTQIDTLQNGTDQINRRVETLINFVSLATQFSKDQKRIAAMTRVLALNASLLSSRASEQQDPEQFASVAREFETIAAQVNDLATQTNQSLILLQQRTGQIQTVVSGLDQDVAEINQLVQAFTHGVGQSRQSFSYIQTVTTQVAQAEQQVTQASQEIAEAAQTTLQAIQAIAALATDTEHQTQTARSQSSSMEELAHNLSEMVKFFSVPTHRGVLSAEMEARDLMLQATL